MKRKLIATVFILFVIAGTVSFVPAFADHPKATVEMGMGSSVPGCEEKNECYIPYEVTVDVGGEVTWVNDDAGHTVTAGDLNADQNLVGVDYPNGFDSGFFTAGNSFSHKFEVAGEYPYFCQVHPWMTGIVIVEADEDEDTKEEHEESEKGHETVSIQGMSEDGTVKVDIMTSVPEANESIVIEIKFSDSQGNEQKHMNYDIVATQNGKQVLSEMGNHLMESNAKHTTMSLDSDKPVDIEVTLLGIGMNEPFTGPKGEVITFNVVPEFGTIAMVILAVSIVSIIALSAKTRIIPRV